VEDRAVNLPKFAYFRGRIVPYSEAKVGVLTHTLNYGTGAFGGIRGYWNSDAEELYVFRVRDHYRRFLDSARLLCMTVPHTVDGLAQVTVDLLRNENHRTDCYIRPLAYYADETIGVRLYNLHPEISIVSFPFGSYVTNEEDLHASISSWMRVDDNVIPPRGKIVGSYVNSALAKTDAHRAGYDEAIVLNHNGHVSEGSAENLFMIRSGVAVTSTITDNILEGITRRTMAQLLRAELGVEVVERVIDRSELYLAEEAFFCGTGVQMAAITSIDHRPVGTGKIGPITAKLRRLYFDVVRGRVPKYMDWCTPVYQAKAVAAMA
jgi:branched-chain amino acid aminotransferase